MPGRTHVGLFSSLASSVRRSRAALPIWLAAFALLAGASNGTKTETKVLRDEDGNVIGTSVVTYTDTDGDGKYDKAVFEWKDSQNRTTMRSTDTDENNDGRAEKSVVELFTDPTKAQAPSQTTVRTRGQRDAGWKTVVTEIDQDQDGTVEEKTTSSSTQGNSRFDRVETLTDSNDNGVFERREIKLADPGGNQFKVKITETFNDANGNSNNDRSEKVGEFGETPTSQDSPDMLKPSPTATSGGRAEGQGSSSVDSDNGLPKLALHGVLQAPLGSIEDPLLDPALLAQFIAPGMTAVSQDRLENTNLEELRLLDSDNVFLRGVIRELQIIPDEVGAGSLDPAASIAFVGAFDLDTLRIAGVDPTSPFYDPSMIGPVSPFMLLLDSLFNPVSPDYLSSGGLLFRFDAFDDLRDAEGNLATGASARGIFSLQAIPEPGTAPLVLGALVWMLLSARRKALGLVANPGGAVQ